LYLPFRKKANIFGSDLSKMDQTWSNWSSHQSKNVAIKSCHIYHDGKNDHYFFWSDWIRTVQNGSNLMKLESSHIKKCHIHHEDKNGHFILNQIGSDISKMDQIGFLPNQKILSHIFWEGHKILKNLHLTFVLCSASQK
jgi:hypothetical protein